MTITTFTAIVSFLVLLSHVLFVLLAVSYLPLDPVRRFNTYLINLLKKYGQLVATVIASVSLVSPLIFSNIYYLMPCNLCWYQRIFMFPIAILLITAQIRGKAIDKVSMYVLAALGTITALFHYVSQRLHSSAPGFFDGVVGCDAIGMSASCSEFYFLEYGYITIPLMALTAFLFIAVAIFFSDKR
ncbi:MAG: disulfide bond formation protein B [Candidatus Kaiserbacteria bacterium]|nr:disulfide bond formation protein B [Candidatus Kaiserbacteria bacterium]